MAKFKDIFDALKLRSSLQNRLLEECWSEMTGTEVARSILQESGRTDVKVCIHANRNCYSLMINMIGLTEDVANSRSILAVAIAAHEVGHAFQLTVFEKLNSFLKSSRVFCWLSCIGEWFMLIPLLLKIMRFSVSSTESQFQKRGERKFERHQFQKNPKSYRFNYLLDLVQLLFLLAVNMLLFPIKLSIGVVCWSGVVILVPLSIGCAFVCRCFIFLDEIHASAIALRLLKQYKILSIQQQKAAKRFLLACAFTYLRSCSFDRLLA